jgi:hypothetical protein
VGYLQSALEDSRAAMHDGSGGLRRLAKMIDECFPERSDDGGDDFEPPGRRKGIRNKLFGMFGNKPKPKVGGNSDTYQIITPFVSEESG